jgi:hypothetical protein
MHTHCHTALTHTHTHTSLSLSRARAHSLSHTHLQALFHWSVNYNYFLLHFYFLCTRSGTPIPSFAEELYNILCSVKALFRLCQASFAHAYSFKALFRLCEGSMNIKAPIASFSEELAHVFGEVSARKIQAHNRMWQRVPLCTYMGLGIYIYKVYIHTYIHTYIYIYIYIYLHIYIYIYIYI